MVEGQMDQWLALGIFLLGAGSGALLTRIAHISGTGGTVPPKTRWRFIHRTPDEGPGVLPSTVRSYSAAPEAAK
jgi:hypothetical protein